MRKRVTMALLIASIAAARAQSLPRRRAVRPVPSVCATMSEGNVFISYYGPVSSCTFVAQSPYAVGETLDFGVQAFGYSFACDAHSVAWDFGDSTSAVGQPGVRITHAYAAPGMYLAIASVSNRTQTLHIAARVFVGNAIP